MSTFTVHEPPNPPADRIDRADALLFVKDGFSWLTALFPLLGFIAQSLWLPAVAYVVIVSIVAWVLDQLSLDAAWISLLVMALNVYLGFELSTIKRWSLDQAGWRTVGTVTGKNLDDCERRFMESWLPDQPAVSTHRGGHGSSGGASPVPTSGQPSSVVARPKAASVRMWPFATKRS